KNILRAFGHSLRPVGAQLRLEILARNELHHHRDPVGGLKRSKKPCSVRMRETSQDASLLKKPIGVLAADALRPEQLYDFRSVRDEMANFVHPCVHARAQLA